LKFDKKTGLITGAPKRAGSFTVKIGYTYATRKITRTTTLVVTNQ
ncbi:MAG: putative Ig domain-containing protein, partial [Kiritimatiellia bacterium]